MPTYQYACTHCDHRFEAVQAFSDASLSQCPICDGKLRKLYGAVGIVFKGSGFYRTDSRRNSDGAKSSDDGSSKSESSSGGSKSESTSNGKSDSSSSSSSNSSSSSATKKAS